MVIPARYPLRGRTCLHRAIVPRAKPREDSAHGICRRAAREGWRDQRNRSEKAGFFQDMYVVQLDGNHIPPRKLAHESDLELMMRAEERHSA